MPSPTVPRSMRNDEAFQFGCRSSTRASRAELLAFVDRDRHLDAADGRTCFLKRRPRRRKLGVDALVEDDDLGGFDLRLTMVARRLLPRQASQYGREVLIRVADLLRRGRGESPLGSMAARVLASCWNCSCSPPWSWRRLCNSRSSVAWKARELAEFYRNYPSASHAGWLAVEHQAR